MRALLLLMLLLAGTTTGMTQTPHPLEGRLWAVDSGQFLRREELFDRLPPGGWLLLGEQHDHPEHHRIQTDWIIALAERRQLGSVALEMASLEQQPYLDAARGRGDQASPESLHWQSGWPWSLYAEVVRTALNHAPAVAAADLPREDQRHAYREGAPGGDLGQEHAAAMRELLYESHCGQIPQHALDGMRQVQLARDQRMADVLRRYADTARTGVLLTGAIHARRDLGIPRWLSRPVVSVLLVPVDAGDSPDDYLPDGLAGYPATDYLLFTSALPDRDYCADMAPERG